VNYILKIRQLKNADSPKVNGGGAWENRKRVDGT